MSNSQPKQSSVGTRPRILMISVRADHGGGPAHMLTLSKHLKSKYDIHVALPKEPPYWERFEELLGAERLIAIPHRKFTAQALFKLTREIGLRKIDLIHSHGKGAGLYSRIAGLLSRRKVVHTFHGVHLGSYGQMKRGAYLALEKVLSLITDRIIAVSTSERKQMIDLKIAIPSRIALIENGIEVPESIRNKALASEPYLIVSVTRFDYAKNPELLAVIIKMMLSSPSGNQYKFDIVGDGEGRRLFENEISNHISSGAVVMHGFVDDPFRIIEDGWIYLSTSRWESFGLAVAEALVRSIPVVATEVTGSIDLIENGKNGFLFPLEKPDECVKAIETLRFNPELYQSMSLNARNSSQYRFSSTRMADETGQVYRDLLET